MVSLRPITDANRDAVEALHVTPGQSRFVSGVRESLLEAAQEPDAQALYWAIYADETPVGFVMIADEVVNPDYIPHFLWKLLIDERHQRRGSGRRRSTWSSSLPRPGCRGAVDEHRQGRGQPGTFYECYGFQRTGDLQGDETLLRLEIPPAPEGP